MKPFSYLLFTVSLLLLYACKDTPQSVAPEPVAGKGGNATLSIVSKHHSQNIDSITVYIKYNRQDPATAYDDSTKAVMVSGQLTATFTNLKLAICGIPCTITEEKQLNITLPVTETH